MIRKSKKFSWPKKLYDKDRITDENRLVKKYGLKNKREIWKTDAKVKYFRNRAKSLVTADLAEQKVFFGKLNMIGLNVQTTADVLALGKEDLLNRRLSTILMKKNMGTTPKKARQMITHKKIMINDKLVNVPGYLVKVEEEEWISERRNVKKPKVVEAAEEKVIENVEIVETKEEKKEEASEKVEEKVEESKE